jgi:Ser/Thr protein kinase RdoA (MazF antagonist)
MDSQNLCAVRPLSYWPEWNAIAMEELKCRPLSAFHPRMSIQALRGPGAIAFETLLERAGRWLSIFHRTMGEMQIEPVSMPLLKSEFEDRLSQLQEFLGPRKELIHVRKMFMERIDAFQDASLPLVRLHGDFKSSNILISTDGRLAAVDTKMRYRGPIYMDIAKLLCDLQTDHFSAMTLGVFAHSHAWRKAFLSGYFGPEPCNERALQIYSVLAALDKWTWDEKLLAPRGPRYAPVRLLLRRHFPRLLIRMME